MNQVRIIPLDTVLHVDKTAIGPKALSLVRLSRLGLAIPAGFCITAATFQEHLEQNNLLGHLKSTADELAKTGPLEKEKLLFVLRQVNVGAATKIIKTGQKIQVGGDSGVVRILQ